VASAAPIPVGVFRGVLVVVGTVFLLFITVSCAVRMRVLCCAFEMERIDTSLVSANMVNEIFFPQSDTVGNFVRDSVSTSHFAVTVHRPVAVTKHGPVAVTEHRAYPNPAPIHVNMTEVEPIPCYSHS